MLTTQVSARFQNTPSGIGFMGQRKSKSISVAELLTEIATVALDNNDARLRYGTRSARGKPERALNVLDKLDGAN